LINDKFVYNIRRTITSEVLTIDELAVKLLPHEKLEAVKTAIVSIVELGSKIKDIKTGLPLINAKYHVFVRSLEGGFVSLYPKKKVFTERHKEYNNAPVYELMNCIRCGQEYIVGSIDQDNEGNDILLPVSDLGRKNEIFMLCNEEHHFVKEDEDEWDSDGNMVEKEILHFYLCPKCGKLYESEAKDVECCQVEKVHLLKINTKNERNLCLQCGRNRAGTLKKMTTGEDASTEILTRTLYQLLPAEKKVIRKNLDSQSDSIYGSIYDVEEISEELELGRKLLMFSDSRQEAAKFAMFLQGRYNEWLWKNLIWSCVNKLSLDEEVSFDRLVGIVQKAAKGYSLFSITDTDDDEKSIVATYLMKEFIEFEPRISLSGLGLIDISFNVDVINEGIFKPFTFMKRGVSIMGMMISIALRFIPTLLNESQKILKAQASRGVDFNDGSFKEKVMQIVSLLVPMFVISYKKAEDLAYAMEARGYIPGKERTKLEVLKYQTKDILSYIFIFIFISLIIIGKIYKVI
jgi:hypothetical protein